MKYIGWIIIGLALFTFIAYLDKGRRLILKSGEKRPTNLGCFLGLVPLFLVGAACLVPSLSSVFLYSALAVFVLWIILSKLNYMVRAANDPSCESTTYDYDPIDDDLEDLEEDEELDGDDEQEKGYALDRLNELVGLSETKREIASLSNYIQMKQKREEMGLKSPDVSYHCVFTGNPGTGKTTVARILADIYREQGVLETGHLVETDRSGLVAEYVGQTAIKTNKTIDEAIDGVLFIDEAYSLIQSEKDDYGKEAVATLLKRIEDDRDRLVVILAGYTAEIEGFINSNPGLRSRFNRYIHFPDYSADELFSIFCLMMKKSEYHLSVDAARCLKEELRATIANKPRDFGNARYVRNLFERIVQNQANRLARETKLTMDLMTEIREEDILAN